MSVLWWCLQACASVCRSWLGPGRASHAGEWLSGRPALPEPGCSCPALPLSLTRRHSRQHVFALSLLLYLLRSLTPSVCRSWPTPGLAQAFDSRYLWLLRNTCCFCRVLTEGRRELALPGGAVAVAAAAACCLTRGRHRRSVALLSGRSKNIHLLPVSLNLVFITCVLCGVFFWLS